jgi:hypothetical protein
LYRREEPLKLPSRSQGFQGAETYCYSGGAVVEYPKLRRAYDDLQPVLFRRLLGEYLRLENLDERVSHTAILLDQWARFFDVRMAFAWIGT